MGELDTKRNISPFGWVLLRFHMRIGCGAQVGCGPRWGPENHIGFVARLVKAPRIQKEFLNIESYLDHLSKIF